ncbi:orexin receptor type 1 [Elysia marginata]|uniref:Orexin receptor type 1 n=1 Tax=Elysia marginata TaxID=1093978 RepID=A0AAV4IYL5_9GAST|nr:orexin receptor type 1 [Elysia marginata]
MNISDQSSVTLSFHLEPSNCGLCVSVSSEGDQQAIVSQLMARRRTAKMLVVVVIVFFICFMPNYVWNILRHTVSLQLGSINHLVPAITLITQLLVYTNSCTNPIIYNFMSASTVSLGIGTLGPSVWFRIMAFLVQESSIIFKGTESSSFQSLRKFAVIEIFAKSSSEFSKRRHLVKIVSPDSSSDQIRWGLLSEQVSEGVPVGMRMLFAVFPAGETTAKPSPPALWPSGKDTRSEIGRYGFDPGPSQTKDFKIGITVVADLPRVWHYGFSATSGRPGVRIM